ncbi:PrgI family protein [Candidatus Kaiserbacteria bacterium]|nr:PrgI family protein [Candidatus Kaiserbacteria bacterium]MCB9812393.1 PrgI family protein [Candidatus Nomurabacteria bacterium]
MRFEVPQFIEVEDKIFGPLTWRQFLYLGGGIGMSVVMFITLGFFAFLLIGLPIALLSGALAFYPVNGRSFDHFLESVINYTFKQRLYLWKQKADIVHKNETPEETRPTRPYVTPPTPSREQAPQNGVTSMARRLELQALQKTE